MEKEMGEQRTRTMSVELAMQREMAFRRKIKELQLQPSDDSENEIMPVLVQFPSRNPSRPDVNSSSSLSGKEQVSKKSQNPSSKTNICFDPRISKTKQLASSGKSTSQQLQLSKGCNLNHKSLMFFCEVCQVPCSGSLNYEQHISGKKHKVKVQEPEFSRKDGDDTGAMANQKPWCKLCNIWCTDVNLLDQHLAGKKHKKMEEKLESATTVEEPNWCELCSIGCSSKELLQLHFNGKKHQAELRKLEYCAQKGREEEQNQQKRCKFGSEITRTIAEDHMEKK